MRRLTLIGFGYFHVCNSCEVPDKNVLPWKHLRREERDRHKIEPTDFRTGGGRQLYPVDLLSAFAFGAPVLGEGVGR